jgi:cell fate (sporulation/competence/biofilm development) regulator YlbF (YheA/YmcA/DUF963 family)
MASSSFALPVAHSISYPPTEKLGHNNYEMWKAQVLSAINGAQMAHTIDPNFVTPPKEIVKSTEKPMEKIPNPEYVTWFAKDQQVLNYILSSLSREVMSQVTTTTTAAGSWMAIEGMFAAQSRAHVINTRMALATTQKGTSTVTEYFTCMKTLTEEMASAGKKLDDEELTSYILAGLDIDLNPLVSAIAARVEPITQMTSFE